MEQILRAICQKAGLKGQDIRTLSGGQVNSVFQVDGEYVVRIGSRADAFQRLSHETELLQSLAGEIPVPKIYAFGQQDGYVYQIQQHLPGQKLYSVWKDLPATAQENIVAELARSLQILHSRTAPFFGHGRADTPAYSSWSNFLSDKFKHTLVELDACHICMAPGFVEAAVHYFEEHQHCLEGGVPVQIHGDLTLVNILVDQGKISAILDFEYGLQAPRDYELWVMEAFCLYPNDWAEEDHAVCCTADFANFFPLLRKYAPGLFETPHLRERVNLYQLDATLSSYLAWRKDNLSTIPAETMAAKGFYMARITNFTFRHGSRMF